MNSVEIEKKIDLLVAKQIELQEEVVNLIGILNNPKEEEPIKKTIHLAIEDFRKLMEETLQKNYDTYENLGWVAAITVSKGSKYAKLFNVSKGSGKQILAFINMNNGDVLKPASFKIPAKHSRGNVYDADGGAQAVTPNGMIRYLKG